MLTIPLIDWVAKVGPGRSKLASFSIAKYGAQTGNDWQWFPDAGNGVRTNGQFVTGNDPNDANVAVERGLSAGLGAAPGRPLGHERGGRPALLHPRQRAEPLALDASRRAADRRDDGRDQEQDGRLRARESRRSIRRRSSSDPRNGAGAATSTAASISNTEARTGGGSLPDRNNHGGADYLPWLLGQLRQSSAATGQRLLDVFTVHYYPQGGEFSDDVSSAMQLRRNRSTRSLWDPAYVDETWINDRVQLIPRLKSWVDTYYPGTLTGITEYNWGAENHINGATTQADIFGIFGREGLDMAARWTTPASSTPTYKAMKMYRNYDGNKSAFGETSVAAATPNPDAVSAFAALRSADGALTVMVDQQAVVGEHDARRSTSRPSRIGGTAQVWQLTAANAIAHLADIGVAGTSFVRHAPAAERHALRRARQRQRAGPSVAACQRANHPLAVLTAENS